MKAIRIAKRLVYRLASALLVPELEAAVRRDLLDAASANARRFASLHERLTAVRDDLRMETSAAKLELEKGHAAVAKRQDVLADSANRGIEGVTQKVNRWILEADHTIIALRREVDKGQESRAKVDEIERWARKQLHDVWLHLENCLSPLETTVKSLREFRERQAEWNDSLGSRLASIDAAMAKLDARLTELENPSTLQETPHQTPVPESADEPTDIPIGGTD